MLTRVVICAVALVACAWFAVGIRQAHDIAAATGAIASHGSARQLADAQSSLGSAAFLNPDQEVQILRGRLAIDQGHPQRAQRILAAVTRAEPMNLEAWIWLTGATLGDPPLAHAALDHIYQLDPLARP